MIFLAYIAFLTSLFGVGAATYYGRVDLMFLFTMLGTGSIFCLVKATKGDDE